MQSTRGVDDFDDLTIPEQPRFAGLEVAFDPAVIRACERSLRASRRRARLHRVVPQRGAGTVVACPRARRSAGRRVASISILLTTCAAVVIAGVLV